MKSFGKIIASALLSVLMAVTPFAGCSASFSVEVKAPNVTESGSVVSESTESQVGLTSGFPLSYDGGLERDE